MGDGSPASAFARHPELLCRPIPAPLDRDVVVVTGSRRLRVRLELDQILDLEAIRAQQPDPVAVCQVELRPDLSGPLNAVHAELRPLKLFGLRTGGRSRQIRED